MLKQQQLAQTLLGNKGIGLLKGFNGAAPGVNSPFGLGKLLPKGTDFSADRDKVTSSVFNQALGLLQPVWDQQNRAREQQLANRGLPISGEAYQTDYSNRERDRNNTLNQLAMQAVLAGGQEQSRQLQNVLNTSQVGFGEALQGKQFGLQAQQQGLAQILQLLGAGGPVTQPNFFAPGQVPVQSFATPQGPGAGAGIGTALGTAAGAGIGGALGGLPGALLGSGLGGGFGGVFGGLF